MSTALFVHQDGYIAAARRSMGKVSYYCVRGVPFDELQQHEQDLIELDHEAPQFVYQAAAFSRSPTNFDWGEIKWPTWELTPSTALAHVLPVMPARFADGEEFVVYDSFLVAAAMQIQEREMLAARERLDEELARLRVAFERSVNRANSFEALMKESLSHYETESGEVSVQHGDDQRMTVEATLVRSVQGASPVWAIHQYLNDIINPENHDEMRWSLTHVPSGRMVGATRGYGRHAYSSVEHAMLMLAALECTTVDWSDPFVEQAFDDHWSELSIARACWLEMVLREG